MALHLQVSRRLCTNTFIPTNYKPFSRQVIVICRCPKSTTTEDTKINEEPSDDSSHVQTCPPDFPTSDWIGPVEPKSNLHRVQFAHPIDETMTEKRYRLLRENTYQWNQEFWSKQNEKFVKAKQQFTQTIITFKGQSTTNEDGTKRVLTAEELAKFYTGFLAQNRIEFRTYNREWYKRNLYMLWPATCAAVVKLSKSFRVRKPP